MLDTFPFSHMSSYLQSRNAMIQTYRTFSLSLSYYVPVSNLVSYIEVKTVAEGVQKQGAEEYIWISEGSNNKRLE